MLIGNPSTGGAAFYWIDSGLLKGMGSRAPYSQILVSSFNSFNSITTYDAEPCKIGKINHLSGRFYTVRLLCSWVSPIGV